MNTMQITAPTFPQLFSLFFSSGHAINTVFTSIWFSDLTRVPTRCYAPVVLSERVCTSRFFREI